MAQVNPVVGMVLYGYCNGYFGRDSYGDKRIEVVAYDYIVVRSSAGPELLINDIEGQITIDEKWLTPEEEY